MKQNTKNLVLAAMFLAIGLVLPFFTGQIPQIGSMLLPDVYKRQMRGTGRPAQAGRGARRNRLARLRGRP